VESGIGAGYGKINQVHLHRPVPKKKGECWKKMYVTNITSRKPGINEGIYIRYGQERIPGNSWNNFRKCIKYLGG
jgi:hypothetical protein